MIVCYTMRAVSGTSLTCVCHLNHKLLITALLMLLLQRCALCACVCVRVCVCVCVHAYTWYVYSMRMYTCEPMVKFPA